MTCSSPYLYDTLIDPWNVYMCVCVCVFLQNVHSEFIAFPYDLTIVSHKCLNSK